MREEDEIRAAVVALAEAVERGEVAEGELLSGAGLPASFLGEGDDKGASLGEPEVPQVETLSPEEQRERAIAAVFDAVRLATRGSRLSQPAQWEAQGLVPDVMTAEDLEMAVYDRLMEAGGAQPEIASERLGDGAVAGGAEAPERPRNKHVNSPFSSSNGRAVGAPAFKRRHATAEAPAVADGEAPSHGSGEGEPGTEHASGDVAVGLEVTEQVMDGVEDQESSEGVFSAAAADAADADAAEATEGTEAVPRFPECEGIRLLMGASSYYLYDSAAMTDSYARWAFLAAEDDPVATFVECVREESAVYPRPMARATLANDPFHLDAAAVEEAFAAAVAQGRAEDIRRIEASNGDVYFFSTRFLTPVRAQALAEWDAVERKRNV